jgi:hypothetical protein
LVLIVRGSEITICRLSPSIWVGLPYTPIRKLSDTRTVREQDILLAISEFDRFNAGFFYPLDGTIWKDAFFFTVFKYTLDCTVRETEILLKRKNN